MSYPIKYPTPQGANVQIFNASYNGDYATWVKPQGASFVWFTLIGAGACGDGTFGGGSGAVTNCMVPAFLIPDSLTVQVGRGGVSGNGGATVVRYKSSGTYNLIQSNGGTSVGGTGGTASTSNYFTAMGIFQSVAGQNGAAGSIFPSSTTFLSGGAGSSIGNVTTNYGYVVGGSGGSNAAGIFQMQPIIVGGGSSGTATTTKGGIGCGGNYNSAGGDGLVVIITW